MTQTENYGVTATGQLASTQVFEFSELYAQYGGCGAYCTIKLTVNMLSENYSIEYPKYDIWSSGDADFLRALSKVVLAAQAKIYELFPKAIPSASSLHGVGAMSDQDYVEAFVKEFKCLPKRLKGKSIVITEDMIENLKHA